MTTLIAQKKLEKRTRLLDAAFTLFMHQGVSSTTIAEICTEANIAKGTFYLYFKDKDDILRALTKRISFTVIEESYQSIGEHQGFIEDAIIMADFLIQYFQNDKGIVSLLKKDFTWPISLEDFLTTDHPTMIAIRKEINDFSIQSGLSFNVILFRLYALISMICSVCYSCIIDNFPGDIQDFKEEIFTMIRKSFN